MLSKKDLLELETRRKIYNFILKNPGSYLREISRKMNMPKTTLEYHLKYLEKHGLIKTNFESRYKRYFVANKLGKREKEILSLLKQEVTRNLLLYMMFSVVCSQVELSRALEKSPATINHHLKKLKDLGLIKYATIRNGKVCSDNTAVYDREIARNEIFYIFIDREVFYTIEDLLIIYKDSIPCPYFINYLLHYDINKEGLSKKELSLYRKKYEKNIDGIIDMLVDIFFDVFPHPYHV